MIIFFFILLLKLRFNLLITNSYIFNPFYKGLIFFCFCLFFQNEPVPGPLPLGVAVIDSSVKLYGVIFPHVAHKHRYQMLQHFNECIRQAKGPRQQAVQMNIFTAVLCALKVQYAYFPYFIN